MADLITSEEIQVIVKPDPATIIYTGSTITNAIGSGATTVSVVGSQMTIYTAFGSTIWGAISGTLADQTDLKNALDAKLDTTVFNNYTGSTSFVSQSDFNTYTGDTEIVLQSIDDDLTTLFNDVQSFETYTGNTDTQLTGIESDILDLETTKLDTSIYSGYTGETDTRISSIETDITTLNSQVIYLSGQTDLRLLTTDFNTYTGQTETELIALESEFDNYVPSSGGTFTGKVFGTDLQLSGTLTANKITSVYTENVLVKDQYVYLRSGATTGLGAQEVAGVAALNVDGAGTTAIMGVTNDGLIRVGWSGDTLQAVATREDSPVNLGIATWSNALEMFVTSGLTMSELQGLETDFNAHTGQTDIHYAQSAITITESQVSGLTADLGDKLDTTVYATYTGETDTRLTGIESDIDTLQTNVSSNDTDISNLQTDVAAKADKLVTINSITASTYTTVDGDSNEIIECASGCTGVTLHSGATTGFQVTFVNLGGQTITFSAQSGSTLTSKDSNTSLASAYGAVSAYKNGSIWRIIGDLS